MKDASMTQVSVVIPVFNKHELTRRCLESLFQGGQKYAGVYVIDNGSTDSTRALLEQYPQIRVIQNEKNIGFGRACNQGVRAALREKSTPTWIAILNNDTWLMPGWSEALSNEANRHGLDCIGPFFDERPLEGAEETQELTRRSQQFLKSQRRSQLRHHFVPMLMFWRVSSLQKLLFDHGAPFDERFFVTYEDTDLLHRARQLDMKWGETNQCYMWHASRATRGDQNLLPTGYEQEGLSLFQQKWGFDPRRADHTFLAKLKRRWREGRRRSGLF